MGNACDLTSPQADGPRLLSLCITNIRMQPVQITQKKRRNLELPLELASFI